MSDTRRRFLKSSVLGLAAMAAAPARGATSGDGQGQAPPGMPPAFGTGPAVGPEVTPATIAEAEKLMQVELTPAERAQAAGNWRVSLAPLCERRTGPRRVVLEPTLAPASRWDPALPGLPAGPARSRFVRSADTGGPLPVRDEDIAFARLPSLSRWIESRALSSERLTRICLERLERFQPKLNCATSSTPRGSRRPTAPSPSAIACPRRTRSSSTVCIGRAPFSWRSSASGR
jgi:hypothetical protein